MASVDIKFLWIAKSLYYPLQKSTILKDYFRVSLISFTTLKSLCIFFLSLSPNYK